MTNTVPNQGMVYSDALAGLLEMKDFLHIEIV